ncbi:DUF4123 domain-containing protein [Aliamphritea ceti]|uniref:DUF4123 domain-containing protein n=1 Tax=Aliamphritea ceti TaxID=1524258 RepID=UPI0021C461F7|nr:DUF4123 domain-containing protein [Aliamphritea ceti]
MQSSHPVLLREQLNQLQEVSSEGLNFFLVLSGTSEANALQHFYSQGESGAKPLWLNTPYRDWEEVMPHLAPIEPDSAFIDWLDEQGEAFPDWGWLVVSPFGFDAVFSHFESLTKVIMPSGNEVFFRYWDAPQVLPVFQLEEAENVADLMGPVANLISANGSVSHPQSPGIVCRQFPWWELSKQVQQKLFAQNTSTLESNLLQQLIERNPNLYEAYPVNTLKVKIQRFVKSEQASAVITRYSGLEAYLQKELNDAIAYPKH